MRFSKNFLFELEDIYPNKIKKVANHLKAVENSKPLQMKTKAAI